MSAFEISVTSSRFKNKKNMESREPTIVEMAPFSPKSIVQFEDVPVGKTAKRILRVINPSEQDIQVKVTKNVSDLCNVTVDWTENVVPAGNEIEMLLIWNPVTTIACKETLQLSDNRNFRKDVMIILKSKSSQPVKNTRKFPTISSGVQKSTHIRTLRLKSPTSSNKVSKASIQHRKSTYETQRSSGVRTNCTNTKSPHPKISNKVLPKLIVTRTSPLTERNVYVNENPSAQPFQNPECSPFSQESLKENVSPLTPGNIASLIDKLNFTPATESISKGCTNKENLSLEPTPMKHDYKLSGLDISDYLSEVRPRRLLSTDLDDDDIHSDCRKDNVTVDHAVPNKTFEIKKTDTFNISCNESLDISNSDVGRLSVGPVLNKTTTISSNHPMRALEMIQEEEGTNMNASTVSNGGSFQKTYNLNENHENSDLKRDIKLVGTPLRKYSESMKDLSLQSPKNKLGIQGSMPNLNEMETIRSIEQNRYFYQSSHKIAGEERRSMRKENGELSVREDHIDNHLQLRNSLDDSLNVSTSSQASLVSQAELLFNQNEILAQSSRFNINEIGLKSRKNSPTALSVTKSNNNKLSVNSKSTLSYAETSATKYVNVKKRRSLDLSQSDITSNESISSIKANKSQIIHNTQASPPKRLRHDGNVSMFQRPTSVVNALENRQGNCSQTQWKKVKTVHTLSLLKKPTIPQKEKLEKSMRLYDSDLYLQACINPDPFAATTTCDPFLASTMYLDAKAVERHQIDFKKWLNALVTIPADLDTDCNVKIDVGRLFNEVRNKDLILAPTKEEQSMNYLTQYRLEYLRRISIDLFMSEELRIPCSKVAVYVNKNAIRIRSDRNLHLDVVMQRYILELLLCFNPLWLRLGLEVVYGERIHLHSNNDIVGLSSFILNRLFRDKYLEQKYSRAYTLSEQYADTIKRFTLTKFLFLLLFLDKAKTSRIVKHNPCLFNKKSPYKETKEILLKFSSELLANIGDITRELKRWGYVLHHKQTYLDEFDYAFNNISIDLRDGVRLTRVMEIILLRDDLTKQLRVPAISRLQRIFNVNLALKALVDADFHLKGEINAADIVDGHREKTLSLLWQIIYKFRSPKFHSAAATIQRWWRHSWLRVVIKRRIKNKEQVKRNKAATIIQSTYRGHIARKFFKIYKEEINGAAKILQKYARRYLAQRRYSAAREAILKIQKWYRATLLTKQCRNEFLRVRAAVILLQRIYRRRFLADRIFEAALKMRIEIKQARDSAAICIQLYWRSYKKGRAVRLQYLELKQKVIFSQRLYRAKLAAKEKRKSYLELRRAVIKIQNYYRSYKIMCRERETFLRQKYLIIKLQRIRRATLVMREERRLYKQQRSAIVKLQQRFKALLEMKRQRQAYESVKSNVITIQRYYRARLQMKNQYAKYQILRTQVIMIQTRWRATLLARKLRVEYITLQYHTTVIQQKYRARKEMRKVKANYEKLKGAAVCLQNHYRSLIYMRIERTKYLHLRRAIIVIQTRYRAYKKMRYDRARFRGIREATLCLQSYFRSYLQMKRDRSNFLLKKQAAITLQRAFRRTELMKNIRMEYHNLRRAALVTQKYYRAKKSMQKQIKIYQLQRTLIIKIQEIYKAKFLGRQVREKYLKLRNIVIMIQRRFRAKLLMRTERAKYEETRVKVIYLQRCFRAQLAMRHARSIYLNKKKAIVSIQKWYRSVLEMRKCQKDYQEKRKLIIFVQRKVKATIAARVQRKVYLNTLSKITFLQNIWRSTLLMRKQHFYYQRLRSATIVIQNRYRSNLLMLNLRNQYLLIRSLIVSLQRKFRSYLLMKKQRAEFLQLRQTTIFCQRKYRSKLVGLENRQRFLSLKQFLVNFQAYARGFLARKSFQALMTPEKKEMRLRASAAVVIQRHWRGHCIRKRFHNIRLKLLRKNINDLKASSSVVNSVHNKVLDGVSLLRGRFNASEALQVLSRLDRLSRTVPHLLMDHSNFISTFCYGIMAQTIRSEIDKQLIEHCSRIILNLARYNSTTANTFQESGLVTIAQMLLRWCDKDSEIFNTLCTLIWIFVQCPKKRKVIHNFMTTPEAIYLVRETKKLVARKEKMKQNVRNSTILSKNTKKLFSSRALPSLEPDYGVVQNHVYTFISSVFAFDTILCKLNISVV